MMSYFMPTSSISIRRSHEIGYRRSDSRENNYERYDYHKRRYLDQRNDEERRPNQEHSPLYDTNKIGELHDYFCFFQFLPVNS